MASGRGRTSRKGRDHQHASRNPHERHHAPARRTGRSRRPGPVSRPDESRLPDQGMWRAGHGGIFWPSAVSMGDAPDFVRAGEKQDYPGFGQGRITASARRRRTRRRRRRRTPLTRFPRLPTSGGTRTDPLDTAVSDRQGPHGPAATRLPPRVGPVDGGCAAPGPAVVEPYRRAARPEVAGIGRVLLDALTSDPKGCAQ